MAHQPTLKELCPDFFANPVIQELAPRPFWSVSDKNKRPIDMYALETLHEIKGANPELSGATATLDKTIDILHYPSNHAYLLDVMRDNYVVLDIEKSASTHNRQRFLKLPYVYGETSLSKKGLHLVLPKPENFDDFPAATTKLKLQHASGEYEILLNHWVTFTRNMLTRAQNPRGNTDDWNKLYAELATQAKEILRATEAIEWPANDIDSIPDADTIIEKLTDPHIYRKTPQDFLRSDNTPDMSRYEAGWMFKHLYVLQRIIKAPPISTNDHTYTKQDCATLLAYLAKDKLEHRDKHDQIRCGHPYLVYIAKNIVEKM